MSDARLSWLLFGAAFLARYTLYLGTPLFGTDSAQFLLMARWMGEGRFHDALAITYHPLYPMLTAVVGAFTGDLERSGFWISILLGSAAAVPFFQLARSIFGRPAAVVAVLIYAVQPHTVEVHADVMTEGTFAFFFYSSMWLCWRTIQEPSVERSILAGLSASAAYLTRAEGLLAVVLVTFWPAAIAFGRREGRLRRLSGVGVGVAAILLLAFPFLVWVRSQMGTWKLSAKFSVHNAGRALEGEGLTEEDLGAKEGKSVWSQRHMKLIHSVGRLTYIVTVPFLVLGFWGLRGQGLRGSLFYFSFPLLYLAGLVWSLRGVPYMSYRYLIPSMSLLMVMAGLGMEVLVRYLRTRWPEPRATRTSLAALALMILVMVAKAMVPHRTQETAIREAGVWLADRKPKQGTFFSTVDKVNFFAGGGLRGFPFTLREFQREVESRPASFYVFVHKNRDALMESYAEWLQEARRVGDPVHFPAKANPAVWTVTVYPAK